MVPGVFTVFANSLFLVADNPKLLELANSASGDTAGTITISVEGGTPSYSYSWAYKSGYPNMEANSPSSATTDFDYFFNTQGVYSTVFTCTVTDDNGLSQDIDVTVTLIYGVS